MRPADTSAQALDRQFAVFAAMSGPERVTLAVEMAEEAKTISLAGIRSRHPDLDERGVHQAWLTLLHGVEVAALLCGAETHPQ